MNILNSYRYLIDLISRGEHQEQDFKFEISDVRKIAKTLSAFANTTGGRLLIGVKDNGKIFGVRSEEEVHQIISAAQLYCKPEVIIRIRAYRVDGKTILEALVAESIQKPCYAIDIENKPKAYIRINDENVLASAVHLCVWRMESQKTGTLIEYSAQEQILIDYLNAHGSISISRYCKIATIPRQSAIDTLAKFVHFKIAKPLYSENGFVYQLIEE